MRSSALPVAMLLWVLGNQIHCGCCNSKKRLGVLTYIGQMLGRQLERADRSEPKGTCGLHGDSRIVFPIS